MTGEAPQAAKAAEEAGCVTKQDGGSALPSLLQVSSEQLGRAGPAALTDPLTSPTHRAEILRIQLTIH